MTLLQKKNHNSANYLHGEIITGSSHIIGVRDNGKWLNRWHRFSAKGMQWCVFAPLVLSRSINTPTSKLLLDQSTSECMAARTRARSFGSFTLARSPLYRYFCSGLSFLSGAPLLHPTMVYLKCHGGEGVHAHAHAQSDVGQQAGYGLYTGRVAKPLTYTCNVLHVHAYACARLYMCKPTGTQVCARGTHTLTSI